MADVSIEIAGRRYRLACEDGQEDHLRTLARGLDAEAQALLGQMTGVPEEARLMLMIALVTADKRQEAEAAAEAARSDGDERFERLTARVASVEAERDRAAEALEEARAQTLARESAEAEARAALEAAEGARKSAEAELAETRDRLESLRAEMEDARRALDETEEALAALNGPDAEGDAARAARIDALAGRLESLTARLRQP